MSNFKLVRGLVWPVEDEQSCAVAFEELDTLKAIYPHVTNFDSVVQAGGNCGLWPMALSYKFKSVYTFEPDHANFAALAHNCSNHDNVVCIQAALGNGTEAPIHLEGPRTNCGAYQVAPGGHIPVLTIDSLRLPSCGLLCLDIEGYEAKALQGAQALLRRCRPVILLEMKGIGNKYGWSDEETEFWLTSGFGYRRVASLLRDRLYVPG